MHMEMLIALRVIRVNGNNIVTFGRVTGDFNSCE
jgi:hypothetical protein